MATYRSDGLRISTYANGISGRGISEIKNYYYASSSDQASALPNQGTNDWKENISDLVNPFSAINKYLWNYEKISYTKIETDTTDPEPTITNPTILGTWGKGFDNIYEYYIITNTDSAPDLPQENEDGTWPDRYEITGVGTWIKEKNGVILPKPTKDAPYLWNYEILNFNDDTDQYFGPTCIGTYGNSISQTIEYYCATATREPVPSRYSNEDTKVINSTVWKNKLEDAGQCETKPFLWNFERTTFSMNEPQDTEVALISSEARSIESITEYYQKNPIKPTVGATEQENDTNHNKMPTIANGWDTVKPELNQGETLWNFEVIKYSASDANGKNLYSWTEPSSVGYMGLDGVSFTGISRRYKTSTTEEGRPTDGPDSEGFDFDSWGFATPSGAGFSETNKYLWMIEQISFDEGDSDYTPIELSAIWSTDGRQYESSKYFYLVNNSAGSYDDVDVIINETTGEPSESTVEGAKWKDTHSELLEGQALWVAEYQKFSRPATGQTKVWEPLPVRLLSYIGTDGVGESGVSLTVSSYVAKPADTSPIHIERNLYGEATDNSISWMWYAKVGSNAEYLITTTNSNYEIYTTDDRDDLYVKPTAFTETDTIQIKIQGTKNGNVLYHDYTTLKLLKDGEDSYIAFLTNPHASISADERGNASTSTEISTSVVVMKGNVAQQVTLGDISSNFFSISKYQGSSSNKNALVKATVIKYNNLTNLGSVNSCSGTINIPITSPINQTLSFNWTKTNTGTSGTSPYLIQFNNDSATIGTNSSGGGYSEEVLKDVSLVSVTVFYGNSNITNNCTFSWDVTGNSDGTNTLSNYNTKEVYFTKLGSDTAVAEVTVKKDGTPLGTKQFTISKNKQGAQGIQGIQGPPGNDGTGINVKASQEDCKEVGDGYINQDTESESYGHLMIVTGKNEDGSLVFTDGGQVKGPAGEASYLHIAYSNSPDGSTDFDTTISTNKKYIGTYVDNVLEDSEDYQDYSWKKWEGDAAVTYKLSISPNSWNKSQITSVIPTFTVTKYVGNNSSAAPTGEYQIRKAGADTSWTNGTAITEATTFELYVKNTAGTFVKVDDETVDMVENGSGIKKINTHVRDFPYYSTSENSWTGLMASQETAYVEPGHSELWTATSSYDNSHILVGDTAYLVGTVKDQFAANGVKQSITLYGIVTAVSSAGVTMTTTNVIWGGTQGDKGDNAQDFNVSASSYMLSADSAGNIKTGSKVTLTAHAMNLDTKKIQWSINDSTWTNMGSSTYDVTATGTYYARVNGTNFKDSVTIGKTIDGTDGADAISINLTNPTMTFNSSTSGESEICRVMVYNGQTKLSTNSETKPYFTVQKSSSQTAINGVNVSGDLITVTDQQSNGSYTVTVTVYDSNGDTLSTQNLTIYWTVVRNGNDSTVAGPQGYSGAMVTLYKRSSTPPSGDSAKPSSSLTYTFSSKALTPSSSLNGWSTTIPTGTNICYAIYAYATSNSTTDTIPTSEWSAPIAIEGKDGDNGINTATVFLYKRAATTPDKPTANLTYTFSTGVLSGELSGWSQIIPASNGYSCYFIQDVIASSEATATIKTTDWSAQQVYVQDGDTEGTITLYYATSSTTPPQARPSGTKLNGWKINIPTSSKSTPNVWSIVGSYTKSNGVTTYGSTWEQPKIYAVQNEINVNQQEYAAYCQLTNFGTKDVYKYGSDGKLYINATYINSGTLTVTDKKNNNANEGNVLFSAGWDAAGNGIVKIGNMTVGDLVSNANQNLFSEELMQPFAVTEYSPLTTKGNGWNMKGTGASGIKFPENMFNVGQQYVLSYKFKQTGGTLCSIGGHSSYYQTTRFVMDGVELVVPSTGAHKGWSDLTNNDGKEHTIEWHFTRLSNPLVSNNIDNSLYIQINRKDTSTAIDFDIWDVKLELGDVATNWTPYTGNTMNVPGNYSWQFSPTTGIKMWNGPQTTTPIFKVDGSGLTMVGNGEFVGKITATDGQVGGWGVGYNVIYNSKLSDGTTPRPNINTDFCGIYSGTSTSGADSEDHVRFFAGATLNSDTSWNFANAPFRVTEKGKLYASSGHIGGWEILPNKLQSSFASISSNSAEPAIVISGTKTVSNSKTSSGHTAQGWQTVHDTAGAMCQIALDSINGIPLKRISGISVNSYETRYTIVLDGEEVHTSNWSTVTNKSIPCIISDNYFTFTIPWNKPTASNVYYIFELRNVSLTYTYSENVPDKKFEVTQQGILKAKNAVFTDSDFQQVNITSGLTSDNIQLKNGKMFLNRLSNPTEYMYDKNNFIICTIIISGGKIVVLANPTSGTVSCKLLSDVT